MDYAYKILLIIGLAFFGIGLIISIAFFVVFGSSIFCFIPCLFIFVGLCFILAYFNNNRKKDKILKKGTMYVAKIYSYVQDTSVIVNGSYPVNLKVRYFDIHQNIKEAIIPTGFPKGSDMYPIGYTINIYEYNGKYGYDPHSVRDEVIGREKELMDNKPVEPDKVKLIGVTCPNCGSSFQASVGYSNRCPYCDSYINV